MKTFLFISLWLACYPTFAQSTTTLAYDVSGNRISKKMQGSGPQPSVVASPQAVNPGQQVALSASGCPGTVKWSTGQQGANVTVTPTVTTQYSASCVIAGCVPGVSNVTVDIIQCVLDEVTVATSATIVRYGQPVTLIAYGCTGKVEWSTGQTGNSAIIDVYGPVTQFTATCTKPYCASAGSAFTYVAGTSGCGTGDVLTTLKSGNWNDPSVWSCGRIPTLTDAVYLADGHLINVNVTGYAKLLIQGGGQLLYPSTEPYYTIVFPSY
ncbi:hypothetical protein [Spirosoma endbachense]|uniref:Ig-like domain-containing protein n=1 Tax=Spirosoma endbachense TaxID=2666025 RepID=A0A6P1VUJ2_9BACT|nr:hypothetical protein [Spirosoma endbachense]QHV95640.1 hypothetical protein GJR95_11770 [Spirosoma endbachense]